MAKRFAAADFKIDGKNFAIPAAFFEHDDFTVSSVPRPYGVRWSESSPAELIQKEMDENPGNVLLIDENVVRFHGAKLKIAPQRMLVVKASEDYKTLERGVLPLIKLLTRRELTKSEKLVVAGGGIVQEVGAFAACIYKRGIPWTLYPSTLLSQCDSCIGGKASVNFAGAKNQLGLYNAAHHIVLCPDFLDTLPKSELRGGLGEILKMHITGGEELLQRYERISPLKNGKDPSRADFKELILGSLAVKKAIVEKDEFESGLRKSLNYGHTVGHAVEALTKFAIPHGHAVTIGVLVANELAARRGLLAAAANKRIANLCWDLLDAESLKLMRSCPVDGITDLLRKDKKSEGQDTSFVLMADVGDTRFVKIKNDEALAQEIQDLLRTLFGRQA